MRGVGGRIDVHMRLIAYDKYLESQWTTLDYAALVLAVSGVAIPGARSCIDIPVSFSYRIDVPLPTAQSAQRCCLIR